MNINNQHIYPIDLISRYFSGELSSQEIQDLNKWLSSDKSNLLLFKEYKKVWDGIEISKIKSQINVDEEWKLMEEEMEGKSRTVELVNPKRYSPFYRIAAIFIIGIFIAASIFVSRNFIFSHKTIYSENAQKEVKLPDGSKIILNTGSKLVYPRKFSGEERSVTLEGEAFFEIEPDKQQPFIVSTQSVSVTVLGTSFNVDAKNKNELVEVTVAEGIVRVQSLADFKKSVTLTKGQRAIFTKSTQELTSGVNDDENYLSWKTRSFFFKNEKLSVVVELLGEVYGKDITIIDEALKDCPVDSDFINYDKVEDILTVLQELFNLEVQFNENKIVISGPGC